MRIHFPSLAAGFLGMMALVLFVAAQRPPTTVGRFQIEATPNYVFVLDRDTGRVWQQYVSTESGQSDHDFNQPKLKN